MFLGYPRSGHSLLGALLDAHPHMVIANELDALKYVYAGFNQRQLFYLLLQNSAAFAADSCKQQSYTYAVPNQWQGRFQQVQVIGDKQAAGSTLRLRAHPELLQRLRRRLGQSIQLKFIHVIRNPYDNISTLAKKHAMTLSDARQTYFLMCQTVVETQKRLPAADWFAVRHEDFIAQPKQKLRDLCQFLGVEAPESYLTDCASIVFASPHLSRREAPWGREQIERVAERLAHFPFLAGYTFEA